MRLGVLSHFMVSRAAHVVLRSSDASSQEVPQVTKTILMAANSFRTPPRSNFSGISIGPLPFLGCNMQPISRKCQMFFCFTSLPDRACVHVFCSFYAFLGVGGALGSAKNGQKYKMFDFSRQRTRLGHTNVCLIRAWFCKKSVPIVCFAYISAFLRDFKRFWDILSSRSPFWVF